MEQKFSFSLVLSINDGNQRIIFAGSTELQPNEVTQLCFAELKHPDAYVIESFVYQPVNIKENEKESA